VTGTIEPTDVAEVPGIGSGLYTPAQARALVLAFDQVSPASTVIGRWMRRRRGRALLTFSDLVSLRVAAALLDQGLALAEVNTAEAALAEKFHVEWPFATEQFVLWGRDIVTEDLDELESAIRPRQRVFRSAMQAGGRLLTAEQIRRAAGRVEAVEFEGGRAVMQRWAKHVVLRPDVQFGEPCIEGTRIPTVTVAALAGRGLGEHEIAEELGLGTEEVKEALAFQDRTAA
jgi:uncharacterized protein (DUF433 family)